MVMEVVRDGREVTTGKERFDTLHERRTDAERVGKGAMLGARLFHDDVIVPLDDLRFDLTDVLIHQNIHIAIAFAGCDGGTL